MSKRSALLIAACGVALAGCGSTPSRVRMPLVDSNGNGAGRYIVEYKRDAAGNLTETKTLGESRTSRMPIEQTRSDILNQISAHEEAWSRAGDELARNKEDIGNLQFGGATLGALGVLAKSLDVGRAGAAIAGAGTVWEGHYQLAVQRNNYKQASDAARCARLKVEAIPNAFFTAYYYQSGGKKGMLRFSRGFLVPGVVDDASYAKLNTLFATINGSVLDMRDRLQKAQESVTLAAPSSTEIVDALQQKSAGNEQRAGFAERARGVFANSIESEFMSGFQQDPQTASTAGRRSKAATSRLLVQMRGRADDGSDLDGLPVDAPQAKAAAADVASQLKAALDLPDDLTTCVAFIAK